MFHNAFFGKQPRPIAKPHSFAAFLHSQNSLSRPAGQVARTCPAAPSHYWSVMRAMAYTKHDKTMQKSDKACHKNHIKLTLAHTHPHLMRGFTFSRGRTSCSCYLSGRNSLECDEASTQARNPHCASTRRIVFSCLRRGACAPGMLSEDLLLDP